MSESLHIAADAQGARNVHVIDGKHEPYRVYEVVGEDSACVQRTAREVARASQILQHAELWEQNFIATIQKVREWCQARASSMRAALVDARSNKVLFYFVPASGSYDLALGDAMTALETELSTAGIGYVESLQVPESSLSRFVASSSLLVWKA